MSNNSNLANAISKYESYTSEELKKEFFRVVKSGNIVLCDALLHKGVDVDTKDEHGMTGLHWAAKNIRPLMVSFLIQRGADPNVICDQTLETPVTIAARENNVPILHYLIEHGGNEFYCDSRNVNILCYAVSNGSALTTEYLV